MRHLTGITLAAALVYSSGAQAQNSDLTRTSMAGPRLGITLVTGHRAEQRVRDAGLRPLMSQFGWHFEQQVAAAARGPAFVIQEVVLAGGVEQQLLIPSATVLFGMRMPSGFEFGLGPNVTPLGTALAIGLGKSFDYGGIHLPVNLAVVSSPGALRLSLLVGYAIDSSR